MLFRIRGWLLGSNISARETQPKEVDVLKAESMRQSHLNEDIPCNVCFLYYKGKKG